MKRLATALAALAAVCAASAADPHAFAQRSLAAVTVAETLPPAVAQPQLHATASEPSRLTAASEDVPDTKKTRQNQGILVPFVIFASVGLACTLLFCAVRTWFVDIYSPRRALSRGQPPRIRKGLFTWIPVVYSAKETVLINTVGLDGVMFLRFLKMGYRLFGLFTLLGLCTIAPVNYFAHPPANIANATGYQIEDLILPALSVDNVPNRSDFLVVHLAMTWVFSFIAIGYIVAYYRGYVLLKLHYDEHALRQTRMSKIDMRSVMVFGIPRELRNEVDLASYFESIGIGHVENVVLCRNWSLLRFAIQKRAAALTQLEKIYALAMRRRDARSRGSSIMGVLCAPVTAAGAEISRLFGSMSSQAANSQNSSASYAHHRAGFAETSPLLSPRHRFASAEGMDPGVYEILSRINTIDPRLRPTHRTGFLGLFGPTVDSAEYYAEQFQEWDRQTARLRRTPERSAPTAVGIVTFESPESATLATQVVLHRRPFACMTKMAPEPRDIYWPNLSSKSASNYTKLVRGLAVISAMFLLVFSSTFVVSSIAGLIDLDQLVVYFPVLKTILSDLPDTWIQFIQGVIPASLLALWTSSLPSVLLLLSQAQGIEAVSWIEMSLLTKYFFYQLWNVLFVTVFARALVYEIIPNPQKVIELLGQMVPKASTTLINYVILQGVAVYPAQLLLVAPLALTWLTRLFPWSRRTPRQISNAYYPSILTCINYGASYPVPILIFIIGVVYAPIVPLVLPFCFIFFAIGYGVYKYMFMYVHLPRYESKGMAAVYAINRCLGGLVIMQLTMMGLLALKASGSVPSLSSSSSSSSMQSTAIFEGQKLSWSIYAQMVAGVLPLLFITAIVYRWLSHGYGKLVANTPMEILGKVALEMESERTGNSSGGHIQGVTGRSRGNGVGVPVSGNGRNSFVGHEMSNQGSSIANGGDRNTYADLGLGLAPSGSTLQRTPTMASQDARNSIGRELNDFSPQSSQRSSEQRESTENAQDSQQQQRLSVASSTADASAWGRSGSRRLSALHTFGRQTLPDVTLDRSSDQHPRPQRRRSLTEIEDGTRQHDLYGSGQVGSDVTATASSSLAALLTIPEASLHEVPAWIAELKKEQKEQHAKRKISTSSLLAGRLSVFEDVPDELSPFSATETQENAITETAPAYPVAGDASTSEPVLGRPRSQAPELPTTVHHYEEPISLDAHLEPPMTRVPGVLDAPVEAASSVLRYGDEFDLDYDPRNDDMVLRTYLHPALIGRLPVAWISDKRQPPRVVEERLNRAADQRELWRRLVSKQRIGVRVAVQDYMQQQQNHHRQMNASSGRSPEDSGLDHNSSHANGNSIGVSISRNSDDVNGAHHNMNHNHDFIVEDTFLHPRIGSRPTESNAVFGRIRSFVDGFASWVHMTIG